MRAAATGGALAAALAVTSLVLWWRTNRTGSPIDEGSIVLLGDSITAQGEWSDLLPDVSVVNEGHPGYTSRQLGPVAERVARRHPGAVYVLAGTNDIRDGRPAGWTRANLARIIDAFQTRSPGTLVVLQTVLPRADAPDAVREINAVIAQLAEEHGVEVLDLHSPFDDGSGGLRTAETTDTVHLTTAGYERWATILAGVIGTTSPTR